MKNKPICMIEKNEKPKKLTKSQKYHKKYYKAHKIERAIAYRQNAPELIKKQKKHNLKRYYGITLKQEKDMRKKQKGICPICKGFFGSKLCIDHDHEVGVVRELLCASCNKGIGNAKENPKILLSMIKYIQKHENKKNL